MARKFIIAILFLGLIGLLAYHFLAKDFIDRYRGIISKGKQSLKISSVPPPQGAQEIVRQEAAPPANKIETTPANPAEVGDDALTEETNGYVACLNRTLPRTTDSQNRYLSWVNAATGPSCRERYISYGLYTLYPDGVQKCREAVDRGKGPPELPKLESAAVQLTEVYAALVPLAEEAYDYYQEEDYKDDQCAGAKKFHPQLLKLFGEFQAAAKIMSQELDQAKGGLAQRQLARIEAQSGRNLHWHSNNFLMGAQDLMKTVPQDAQTPLATEKFLAAYDPFDKDYQAWLDYAGRHSQETQEAFMFSAFESQAKTFYKDAKFLKRRLAEGNKPNPRELSDFLRDYNSLIDWSNSLKFPDQNKALF